MDAKFRHRTCHEMSLDVEKEQNVLFLSLRKKPPTAVTHMNMHLWLNIYLSDRKRLWKTLAALLAIFSHGFGFGVVGSSMLDLMISTGSTLQEISYMVPSRAIGLAFGATTCNFLINRLDIQLLMTLSLAVAGGIEIIIPFSPHWYHVVILFFINGACFGILENCVTQFIVRLWKNECTALLQVMYFFIGFGACISPLIVRPLLLQAASEEEQLLLKPEDVMVQYAYFIIGTVIGLAGAACFTVYCFYPEEQNVKIARSQSESASMLESLCISMTRWICFLLAMIFMFFMCGLEVSYGSFIMPFALSAVIQVDKKTGALMQSIFWMCFTFGRLVTCFYVNLIGPMKSTLLSLVICASAALIVTPSANTSIIYMWIGSVLLGVGVSPMWANLFGYLQTHFPEYSAFLSTSLITIACTGECVIPIIVSALIIKDHMAFLYISSVSVLAMVLSFGILVLFVEFYRKKLSNRAIMKLRPSKSCVKC